MIRDNISGILTKIKAICQKIGRDPEEITLIGVTKFADIAQVNEAIKCGLVHIGENKVQEAFKKFSSLVSCDAKVTKHMIGHLQSNKVKHALDVFDVIQSVDSLKLAVELQRRASQVNRKINVLLQVNTAGEKQKFGIAPEDAVGLIEAMIPMSNVHLQGLMTIAPLTQDTEVIRKCFRDLRLLNDQIREQFSDRNLEMKYLSMGMTDDYEIALEEGSNMIRIGRAIFA